MLGCLMVIKGRDMGKSTNSMVISMKVIGKMEIEKEMELKSGRVETNTRGNGKQIDNMEKVFKSTQME
jgi:hypothetical protein